MTKRRERFVFKVKPHRTTKKEVGPGVITGDGDGRRIGGTEPITSQEATTKPRGSSGALVFQDGVEVFEEESVEKGTRGSWMREVLSAPTVERGQSSNDAGGLGSRLP